MSQKAPELPAITASHKYELFGRVMELIHLDPYYAKTTTADHTNSIYFAIKHDKLLGQISDGRLVGFCTYGFFTQKEIETDKWNGDDVYSRNEGEVLYFPKFQCRAGRKEVIRFIRNIQKMFAERYPEIEIAGGLRVYPDGRVRTEKWHRKLT